MFENSAIPIVKVTSRIYAFSDRLQNQDILLLPKSLEVHLSNVCNHSCKFCFYQNDRKLLHRHSFLPVDRVLSVLDFFHGEKDISLVLSGGGEPTLHPDFDQIVDKAVDIGFDVGVITNGMFYNDKIEKALLKTKWVKFSLHAGNPETYQRLIYQENAAEIFDRVQSNIKSFVAVKTEKTKVSVGCVITQKNQMYCDILNYFDNATDFLHVDYVLFRKYMGDDPKLKITRNQKYFEAIKFMINLRAKAKGVFTNYNSFLRELNTARQYKEGNCPIVSNGLIGVITTDGNVHICLPMAQTQRIPPIGNILETNFAEIWFGDSHRTVLKNLSLTDCPACKYERMFPLIEKITHHQCDIEQEQIRSKMDPHWRFL